MGDTQWSRYEVFGQDKEGRPHRNVGSVHAVDSEMALQNARDVFVRRPQTTSIWVVPAANILSKTKQEINEYLYLRSHIDNEDKKTETYLVFRKISQRPSMTYVVHTGQVEASSGILAMRKSVELFGEKESYVWWVFPERAVYRSSADDIESMFSQAHDKKYRMPKEYRLTLAMMELKRGKR